MGIKLRIKNPTKALRISSAFIAVLLLALGGYCNPVHAAVPTWVSSLPLNQWYSIPNTALSSVAPFPQPAGGSGPSAKIDAWNGAGLKRAGSIYILGAAGGHVDYEGNEVDAITLNTATPQWVQLKGPSTNTHPGGTFGPPQRSAQFFTDLTPNTTHSYYSTQFIESRNRMFIVAPRTALTDGQDPGAGYPYLDDPTIRSFSFNLSTNQWDPPDYVGHYLGGGDYTAAIHVKHQLTDDIYMSRSGASPGGWYKWTQTTNTWARISGVDAGDNYGCAAMDPVRNRILVVGNYGGFLPPRVFDLSGVQQSVTFTGLGAAGLTMDRYPGCIYDEVNNKFLVIRNNGSVIDIRRVDPVTWFVDDPTVTGTKPAARPNDVLGAIQYVPELGGLVIANDYTGNVKFMRLSTAVVGGGPGDVTAPTVPIGLGVTVASSSQLNLSWTASTDAVGVTGYNIYRCTGAACTPTVLLTQIGATTTYSDTGLSGSTLYRYAVSALDAAGNESAKSTTAQGTTSAGGTLNVGTLVIDGPATPEQISLYLPVTGSVPQTTTATVRYKATASPTFIVGHPMYRIQPGLSFTPAVGSVVDAFAWPIIDLQPNTSYDVEVTVCDGANCNIKTLTTTTRALPATAGAPNKTIAAGSSAATIQTALNGLVAGDVLQFANGTYNLSARLTINRTGTLANPIYIRGASRTGVTLSATQPLQLLTGASNIVFENMTLQGRGTDSGVNADSLGIGVGDQNTATNITIRNITMNGIDRAVGPTGFTGELTISGWLVYDNTMAGNNRWTGDFYPPDGTGPPTSPDGILDIHQNVNWNDDGINIPGLGNVAFNNTLSGFGDTMSYASHPGGQTVTIAIGVHYYRNRILSGGDDGTEMDHAQRNVTFYDNYLENTMTAISLDPVYAGPILVARNIAINQGRQPFKFNSTDSGYFLYNNTITHTTTRLLTTDPCAEAGWYQANNGNQQSYAYRNNILVYRGGPSPCGSQTLRLDNGGHTTVDWTNNSWFPNAIFAAFVNSFPNLAAIQAGVPDSTPVFSGNVRRMSADNITVSNPWTQAVIMGATYQTEVTSIYTMQLSPGDAAKNSGAPLANITDGFSGAAPDRGAVIAGRPLLTYGDRSAVALAPLVAPTNVAVTTP